MGFDPEIEMGNWVARVHEYGFGDGIADELSENTAYLVTGVFRNGFLQLFGFIHPVDPQYLRMATGREKFNTKKKYKNLDIPI